MTIEDPYLDLPRTREFHAVQRREPDRDLEYAVLRMLETHGEREGTALASYERVAGESSVGGAVQYLVGLILEDERRHHRVFAEMANESAVVAAATTRQLDAARHRQAHLDPRVHP